MARERILIIGGGPLQVPVVQEARAMGYRPYVVDRDPDCPCHPLASAFYPVDIYDREGVAEVAAASEVEAVAAIAIDAEDTAAYVARELGLPGPPLRAAEITRDKGAFYEALYPRLPGLLADYAVLEEPAAPPFPPPWILRPVDRQGSMGTTIVWEEADFDAAFSTAREASRCGRVLVNKLLPPGEEFSTEVLFTDRGPRYVNSVLRPFLPRAVGGGRAVEIGHLSPAPISRRRHRTLFRLAVEVARLLGVDWGVMKIDTLWPWGHARPYLLEGTLRLSGGCDSTHTFPLAYGRSVVRAYLRLCVRGRISDTDPDLVGPPRRFAAAVGIFAPSGPVAALPDPRRLRDALRVEDVVLYPSKLGSVVRLEDCRSRLGFVLVAGRRPGAVWRRGLEASLAATTFFAFGEPIVKGNKRSGSCGRTPAT